MISDTSKAPLVSVVIPAYKGDFLAFALDSVLQQTYRPIEIVVCDDCRTDEVRLIVEEFSLRADFKVIYHRNQRRLYEINNLARCISLASGDYIKFLYDDDVLDVDCISSLLHLLVNESNISLASSARRRIDESGNQLPDIFATSYPFSGDVIISGQDVVSFLGEHTINFIGEPSSVMCRRADVLEMGTLLSTLNGVRIHWVGDLAIYVKLLLKGNLAMRAKPLSFFRVSKRQFSQIGRDKPGIGQKGHEDFRHSIKQLGFLRDSIENQEVRVAPITSLKARVFKSINLLSGLQRAYGVGHVPLSYWIAERSFRPIQKHMVDERLKQVNGGAHLCIFVLDRHGDLSSLHKTLKSVSAVKKSLQKDVCVLSVDPSVSIDTSMPIHLLDLGNESECLNEQIKKNQCDWFLIIQAGAEVRSESLAICALDLCAAPDECLAVFSDELVRLENDQLGLMLKPDLNLDMLLSMPANLSRNWFFRRTTFLSSGGFSSGCSQAYELDYQLRLIVEHGLGCVGHVSEPLLICQKQELSECSVVREVIARHLKVRGYKDAEVDSRIPGCYDINYKHPVAEPGVTILIVVKDRLMQIQRCMETLLEHTSYRNYEVLLLDHGNTDPALCAWLQAVEQMAVSHLRVLHFDSSLSKHQVCNQAATHARGEFLLWLADGIGVMGKDWLGQMLNHAQRPEVGVVGAKLLAANGQISHAGLVLGLEGPVGRAFVGAQLDDAGYMQRLLVDQNYSAVSADCLMISRQLFEQAQGFDENPLLARWADADLCLRLQQAGYLNVWTPRVQLLLDESQLDPVTEEAEEAMYARWLPLLAKDPAYNTGFSLADEPGFKLADPRISWRPFQAWQSIPSVLAYHADTAGCGHYRVLQPFNAMRDAGLVEGQVLSAHQSIVDVVRYAPNAMVFQRQVSERGLAHMRKIKALTQTFKVFELDDYLPNLPVKNIHRQTMPKDILRSIRQGLSYVDRFVVSTEALADAFSGLHQEIHVIQNALPTHWWQDLKSLRRVGSKPRVGWAGGISHAGDLDLIVDVVKELANEVDWIFMGMCPDVLRPYVAEYHPGVPIHEYPEKLALLNLDLAIAPVEQNLFNECKSNLRLLEYGACGYPVIASDVRCYQETGLPVTLVKNRFKDWVDAIRMHLTNLDAAASVGDQLRAEVLKSWMLEGQNLGRWRAAWTPA